VANHMVVAINQWNITFIRRFKDRDGLFQPLVLC